MAERNAPIERALALGCRLCVKRGRYDEMPTDVNPRQLARLRAERLAAFDRVFREHEDLLAWFGFRLMDTAA